MHNFGFLDTIVGGTGIDTLVFNGANIGETFTAGPNGGHVRFTRNIGAVVLDLDDVERMDLVARGGSDVLTVDDLAGTDLVRLAVDLGGLDSSPDTVIVNGTAAADVISVASVTGGVEASRTGGAITRVTGAELGLDTMVVNGLAGNDVIDVQPGVDALIALVLNP